MTATGYTWKRPDNWDDLMSQSATFGAEWDAWKAAGSPANDKTARGDVPSYKDTYKGWACIHSNSPPEHNHTGMTTDKLLFEIGQMTGAYISIGVDQWWGIRVEGTIENWGDEGAPNWIELNFSTYIQADTLHDGLEETYDVWKSRIEFHKESSDAS